MKIEVNCELTVAVDGGALSLADWSEPGKRWSDGRLETKTLCSFGGDDKIFLGRYSDIFSCIYTYGILSGAHL